jgi:nitroreductase
VTVDPDSLQRLMGERRSVRHFGTFPIDDAQVRRLLEAACAAPSASNRQPYRFMIVRRKATMDRMAAAVIEAAERRFANREDTLGGDSKAYFRNFLHFQDAPVVIVVLFRAVSLASLTASEDNADPVEALRDPLSSAAAAIMQLLLAAHAMGLGACWMTGPCLAEGAILELLRVPDGWRLAALLPIGLPGEPMPVPPRRSIEQLTLAEPDVESRETQALESTEK